MQRGADLGAHAPGAIAHAERVDLDRLLLDAKRAAVATRLVEMATAEIIRLTDRVEGQVDLDLVCVLVDVVELVAAKRLEAAVVDAVGEPDVGQVLVLWIGRCQRFFA